ncbi:hypothetical protein JCM3775_006864 [Rhodotorula graminis]|uniref:ACB domain-containing protein n=1 Tax=Rhodotorula graminis (strain WP1) TaxID=578459 RepID=A0A194SBG8_RHOGW|nr:uncharacterized protein RHOBADRAFT_51609 [Rhodotorula graminis WP1]KPV77800.1 hypothetical protein RHOBADRAFT_51609 [Rhodotorula graminis WP1]
MSPTAFERAVAYVGSSTAPSSTELKLRLYSLYKVATTSSRTPTASRPGLLDFSGRAKWDAWSRLGKEDEIARLSDDEVSDWARRAYVDEARALGFAEELDEVQERPGPRKGKKDQMVAVSTLEDSFVDEAPPSRIHELAIDGDVAALEEFLAGDGKGVDLNERDSYGYAPLHLATDRGHADVVKALLAHGADRSLPDEDGNTALDLARLAEHADLVELLS